LDGETFIHKFQTPEMLCDRPDVIVLTDEAHRSQYDTLALNMRAALPKALFLAFTGTPLIAGEERTKEVFGDYVSIYDFQQSVEDGATVPLFYENRTPELQLVNPDLNENIYDLIEAAEHGFYVLNGCTLLELIGMRRMQSASRQARLRVAYTGGRKDAVVRQVASILFLSSAIHHASRKRALGRQLIRSIRAC
jgi:SWI2/SNF2 ATPase